MTTFAAFNPLDLGILAVLLVGVLIGMWEGISKQVLRLVSYVASIYATIYFQRPVTEFLERNLTEVSPAVPRIFGTVATFLGVYIATFIVGRLVLGVIRARSVKDAVGKVGLGPLDRLLGASVGACAVGLVLGSFFLGVAVYGNEGDEEKLRGSSIRPVLMKAMEKVLVAIPAEQKANLHFALERLKVSAIQTGGDLLGEGAKNLKGKIEQVDQFLKTMQNHVQPPTQHFDKMEKKADDRKVDDRKPNEFLPSPVPTN